LAEGAAPPAEAPAGIVDAAGHVYSGGERKEPAPAVDRRGLGRARLTRQLDPRIGELAVAVAPPAVARAIPGDRASMGSTGADPGEGDATRDRARFPRGLDRAVTELAEVVEAPAVRLACLGQRARVVLARADRNELVPADHRSGDQRT